eukprot:TRINITY_DN53902_c0_g1_i1.p1 TRINITY_DN53902_c0_g1~~TRINITY_DN53902_c0_g1_i1.p1  ORF type:complete len:490 (+),score=98.68 TRINITY_DN53902_c0_g1_i1:21-1490(+)
MEKRVEGFLAKVLDKQFDVELDKDKEKQQLINKRLEKVTAEVGIAEQVPDAEKSTSSSSTDVNTEEDTEERKAPASVNVSTEEVDKQLARLEEAWKALRKQQEATTLAEQRNAARQEELEEWKLLLQRKEMEFGERVSELEHKHHMATTKLNAQREDLKISTQERKAEIEQVSRYSEQINTLGELLRTSDEELGSTAAMLSKKEQEAQQLEHDLAVAKEQLKKKEEDVQKYKSKIEECTEEMYQLQQQLAEKDEVIAALENETTTAKEEVKQWKENVEEVTEALNEKTRDVVEQKRRADELNRQLQDERKNQSVQAVINQHSSPFSSTTSQVSTQPNRVVRKQTTTTPDFTSSPTPTTGHREFSVPSVGQSRGPPPMLFNFVTWRMAKSGVLFAGLLSVLLLTYSMTGTATKSLSAMDVQQRNNDLQTLLVRNQQTLDSCQNALAAVTQQAQQAKQQQEQLQAQAQAQKPQQKVGVVQMKMGVTNGKPA